MTTKRDMLTNKPVAPRKYSAGQRRITYYLSMSVSAETRADLGDRDHRFAALSEARRTFYPDLERFSDPQKYDQGIAGTLGMFFDDFDTSRTLFEESTGQPVPWYLRVDRGGELMPLDERLLEDTDTLVVLSTDHARTGQRPNVGEVQAIRNFLAREGTRLVICPHHDVGATDDWPTREIEHFHHGDAIVSGQERFSGFARALFTTLGIPVENRFALNPALVKGTDEPAPLSIRGDLDARGLLRGVTTFNRHRHLPHYAITSQDTKGAVVLAQQAINLDASPHPFVDAGNREFNALVWLPPADKRAGEVLVVDQTVFLSQFGGKESLWRFWQNLAKW